MCFVRVSALAQQGINANMITAYHHDHVFVPKDKAAKAMEILAGLSHH